MRRGSISVEFGVTLPIILLLLVGVLEWGRMLAREVAVVTIARDAAHAGAITKTNAENVALRQAQDGLRAAGFDPATASVLVQSQANPVGELLKVEVTVPFRPLFGLIPTTPQLYASTILRREAL